MLSPTASALSSLPSDKLAGRSMEGKKLRRHVLRGAVVVFVTAGYSGKKCANTLKSKHDRYDICGAQACALPLPMAVLNSREC